MLKSKQTKKKLGKHKKDTPKKSGKRHPIVYVVPNAEKLEARRRLIANRKPNFNFSKQNLLLKYK